ncbi:MAG: cation/cationic drug transporter [Vulcanimicrobiaceae bacterium]
MPPLWLVAALLSIVSASTGQILLKIGVKAALPPDAIRHPLALLSVFTNPFIVAGVVAFALSMVLWLGAINGQQLSAVYPMAALGYVLVTLVSVRLFHDSLGGWKIAGIGLIIVGVLVLNAGIGNPTIAHDPPNELSTR